MFALGNYINNINIFNLIYNFVSRICYAFVAFAIFEGPLSFVFPTFNLKSHFVEVYCLVFYFESFSLLPLILYMHSKIAFIYSIFNFYIRFIYLIYYIRVEEYLPFQSSYLRMLLPIPFDSSPFPSCNHRSNFLCIHFTRIYPILLYSFIPHSHFPFLRILSSVWEPIFKPNYFRLKIRL